MKKIKCALIGPGNIGTDLLYKLQRSTVLEPVWMVGIDAGSEGLKRAAAMGLKVTSDGVDGLLPHVLTDGIQILHQNPLGLIVESARGFVKNQYRRVFQQRARNRDTLLFAARKFGRAMGQAFLEAEIGEKLGGADTGLTLA